MATIKGNLEGIFQSLNKTKSDDETRYFMNECYLDKTEGTTALVATNDHMLVEFKPNAGVIERLKLADIPQGFVLLDPKRLMITPFTLDGQFLNWRKVVPDSSLYMKMKKNGLAAGDKRYKSADMLARFTLASGVIIKHEYMESIAYFNEGETCVLKDESARSMKAVYYKADTPYGEYLAVIMPYKPE